MALEGFKNSLEEVTVGVVGVARVPEGELKDMTELLQSHDKTLNDEKLILTDEERKCFLKWNSLLVKMP